MSSEGQTTGWPAPALMQDECAGLSQALSKDPTARLHVREAVRMQPRDETAARLEFERAKRLLESHGWTVTAPETMGCEGPAK
jgi:hypothetical protein